MVTRKAGGGGSTLIFNNALNLNGNKLTKTGDGEMAIRNDLVTGGGTIDIQGGTVSGNGTVGGNLDNGGDVVSPGNGAAVGSVVLVLTSLQFAKVLHWV